MTLAHETGHLFYMSRNKERIIWSKKPRTEDQANQFVLLLLKMNDIDENEYKTFYSKALKASKKRKKCWFEP
jgi:Zn-dependent peptidase ImmA (M78 family)